MNTSSDETTEKGYQQLADKIYSLEQRLARLEAAVRTYRTIDEAEISEEKSAVSRKEEPVEEQLESNFGEFGLAWLGNVVLFFGIIFLVEYLERSVSGMIPTVFGFIAVAGIFGIARYFRNSNPYMARIFDLNGYLLVFYVVLKLHFLNANPVISGKAAGLVLLLMVTGILIGLAVRKNYPLLASLSIIMMTVTAVVSDSTHIMLSVAAVISVISMLFLYRYGWISQVWLSVTVVYLISLIWVMGNPFMGHQLEVIKNHNFGFNWIFISAAIFSLIALMPEREESYASDNIIGAVIYNGVGFVFIMGLCFLSFFKDSYALPAGSIAIYCIAYSLILQSRSNWKITGAFYALFGFVALSVSIIGIYGFPHSWTLLSLQSLLVVGMAIWFKSRFIVIMNSLMYIMLLLVYLTFSDSLDAANIAFSLTALVTARILNWAKERISISTVFIRNLYLVTAFFMVLYTLYHLIPRQYVTLSWSIAAVCYFILSLLLKNVKYRYMALGTMLSAALFLLFVDLARVELVYRVLALLFLAFISIGISIWYNKKLRRKLEE